VDDPQRLHEPYLVRNHEILQTLRAGDRDGAERLLAGYLDDSLKGLVEVYARRVADGAQGTG
jgi:DNA-binding GntR family transcriptional regulator